MGLRHPVSDVDQRHHVPNWSGLSVRMSISVVFLKTDNGYFKDVGVGYSGTTVNPRGTFIKSNHNIETPIPRNRNNKALFLLFLGKKFHPPTWKKFNPPKTRGTRRNNNFVKDEPCDQASSANHTQSGWDLNQRGWSNDDCATSPQRRQRRELAWILTVSLSEFGSVGWLMSSRQQWGVRQITACTMLVQYSTWNRNSFYGKEVSVPMYRGTCAFLQRVWHAFKQVFLSTMHVQVCTLNRCFGISEHVCEHDRCRVFTCAHVCAVCSFSVGGRGWGVSVSLWGHFLFGVGGYFWQKER